MELWPSERQEYPFFETSCIFDICFEDSRAEVPPPFAIALLRSWGNATTLLKVNISQVAKSGEIVETLGSTQVMQEKFPVAGLWLVKLLILANHRPATGNFSCITWVDPSVSTICPLLASCVLYISFNKPINQFKVSNGRSAVETITKPTQTFMDGSSLIAPQFGLKSKIFL